MRTLLDGHVLADAGPTLGSALDAVRLKAGSRIVIDVTADGRPVPPEHLDEPPTSVPYAAELAFRTADPVLVAVDALHEALEALAEMAPRHARAAELIQSGKTDEAMGVLSDLLGGWTTLHRTAEIVSATAQVAGETKGRATREAIEPAAVELVARLTEIKSALGLQDWSGLSDTLAYDMGPLVEQWQAALKAMMQGVKAA